MKWIIYTLYCIVFCFGLILMFSLFSTVLQKDGFGKEKMFRCLVAEQELASGNNYYLIKFQKCHGIYFIEFFNSRCHAKLFSVNFFLTRQL